MWESKQELNTKYSTKTRDNINTGFPVLELTILALQPWSFLNFLSAGSTCAPYLGLMEEAAEPFYS